MLRLLIYDCKNQGPQFIPLIEGCILYSSDFTGADFRSANGEKC